MGVFKNLGKVLGEVTGSVIGGTVSLVGDIFDNDTIREIGEGAYRVTANTGKQIGRFADGVTKCAGGIISNDGYKVSDGAQEMFDIVTETAVGVGKGIVNTATIGIDGIEAILEGDEKKAVEVGKKFVKIAAISVLSLGVLDIVDGAMDGSILDSDQDGIIDFFESDDDSTGLVENLNTHHVKPHYRNLSDDNVIWVDGDGDTSTDTFDGWTQSNPDYRE